MKKIAIIGAGKMGGAMYEALKNKFEVRLCKREALIISADIIIFAVKPQDFERASKDLRGAVENPAATTIISIMAGVTLARIQEKTGSQKIVRAMPNLPLQVGAGLTAWLATGQVTDKRTIKEILSCFGEEIEVESEEKLSAITALSGSGPAYFFHLTSLLQEKAKEFGFTEQVAQKIAKQTFIGSSKLFASQNFSASELEKAVTSKGGTTAAAFDYLSKNRFDEIFKSAVEAAEKRCHEL